MTMRGWRTLGIGATLVILGIIPLYAVREGLLRPDRVPRAEAPAAFVGRESCRACHASAYNAWLDSDHDHAMDVASDSTVLGDFDDAVFREGDLTAEFYRRGEEFFVRTQGPDGKPTEFPIAYTFGHDPLQQYLIPFPGGRLQSLTVAWDVERKRWFSTYEGRDIPPGDWLHWTRGGQNWNGMCAECHSTDLRKGYAADADTFSTTWAEIDVSCEACHGPASRHVAWAETPPMGRPPIENYGLLIRTGGVTAREQVELCAPCHSRRTEFGDYDHTRAALMDNQVPALLQEELYFPDGQILDEVYVYGSFVQSKMFKNDVRCSDCHDVHTLKLREEGNALCVRCHQGEVYDSSDHHFHKKIHEGKPSDGALCVKCHMPERPYMVIDWRADHSLRTPRPDLTLQIGVPNACSQRGCHQDKPPAWAADHYRAWYGKARKPHYGTDLALGRTGDPRAPDRLGRLAGDPLQAPIVRASALALLSRYGEDASAEALARALSDEEVLLRYTAVTTMEVPDPARRAGLFGPLLFDGSRLVRMQAAVQLAGIPDTLLKPYQRGELAASLDEYERAMSYSLDFAFANHNLGNLHMRLGETEEAERYFRRAIRIDEVLDAPKVNLAMLLNAQGRNEEAEALLRSVLDRQPDHFEVCYSLGLLLVEMGRSADAVIWLDRASRGLPQRSRVHYNLGLLLQQEGSLAASEAALSRALVLEPANPEYLFALADHYLGRDLPEKALPLAARLTAADPHNPLGAQVRAVAEAAIRAAGP